MKKVQEHVKGQVVALWKTGEFTKKQLSGMFNMCHTTVGRLVNGVQFETMREVDRVIGEVMGHDYSARDQSAIATAAKRKIVLAGMCEDIIKRNIELLHTKMNSAEEATDISYRDQKVINEIVTGAMDSLASGSLHDAMNSVQGVDSISNIAPVINFMEVIDDLADDEAGKPVGNEADDEAGKPDGG